MAFAVAYEQADPDYRRELGQNQSSLKHILKSPAHYKAALNRRFSPTTNMSIGSALHCLVLEGQKTYDASYIVKPDDIKFTTKEGKAWKEEHRRYTILDKEAERKVLGMAETLKSLPDFDGTAKNYRKFNEVSIYWDSDGIDCKARLDRVVDRGDYVEVLDLKTTDSIDPHDFQKKVVGVFNYVFQAAWYAEAASLVYNKPARFTFLGIERDDPFAMGVFTVSEEMMAEGQRQIRRARKILKECLKKKTWEKPEVAYNSLELPSWFRPTDPDEVPFVELF